MFKQLRDWLIYGTLNDKHAEFFICPSDPSKSAQPNAEETLSEMGEYSEQAEPSDLFLQHQSRPSHSQYMLNAAMIPSYLNLKTANKILFAGESLQLFKPKVAGDLGLHDENKLNRGTPCVDQTLRIPSDHFRIQVLADEINVMLERLHGFSRDLLDLSMEPEFSIVNFDRFVDRIRDYVSQVGWSEWRPTPPVFVPNSLLSGPSQRGRSLSKSTICRANCIASKTCSC
jgi:hypothetical protein